MTDQHAVGAPSGKLLLDVDEVAQILGLGRSHLYRFILSGELKSVKCGRRRKVPTDAVTEFIEKLRSEEAACGESTW